MTVRLTEFHPRYSNKQTNLLVFTLEGHTHKSMIKLKITDEKNLQLLNESITTLARTGSVGGQNQGHSTGEVCLKYFLF